MVKDTDDNGLQIETSVDKINRLLQDNEVTIMDDFYEDIFLDKNHKELFRIAHPRFFESQEDADKALEETLLKLSQISPPLG